ncbi:TetR/AcrR family transcriptional regulator [Brevibacterium sp. W7.2]|uniref:TetR/AcrR family transcriptional regulator n=1 Tax=Brevibacterium sp. W7.2 TaxID=2823518 RepID=UPI001BA92C43|nr:TetR/AcrR family transcriptional regulator [Brevibacterium sp. W7.2]
MSRPEPDATKSRLLAAARTCLLNKGYADTTVRDLIGESGTNLASINYHFGSKEVLLNQALFDLNGEWGELLFGAVAAPDLSATERWQRVIEAIDDNRAMWFVNFEAISLAQHNDTIRAGLEERGDAARAVLARAFGGDDDRAGSRHYAMLIGVAAQWLLDPDSAPSAEEITSPTSED